jgi:hypothetical protein
MLMLKQSSCSSNLTDYEFSLKHSQVIQTLEAILITVKTVLKEFLKISSTNVSRQSRTVGM